MSLKSLCCLLITGIFVQLGTAFAAPQASRTSMRPGGVAVFSIVPSQAEPGSQVIVSLTSIQDGMDLLLSGSEVSWRALDDRRITFTIDPETPPGQHSLSVRGRDGTTRSYAFSVVPLKPVAVSIAPDRITSCADNDAREITLTGRNFLPSSQLLFDGAVIRSHVLTTDRIRFTAPVTRGGLHQVAVKNGEYTTTPLGLAIITAPELTNVSIGTDQVNSYELLISGSNFQQTSALLVNGTRIDTAGTPQGEQLHVLDCTRMVYRRLPYSSTPKELRLQVVNPTGETSQTVTVSAP
jgi:hypothetical protein